jgi:hypothetical protein
LPQGWHCLKSQLPTGFARDLQMVTGLNAGNYRTRFGIAPR